MLWDISIKNPINVYSRHLLTKKIKKAIKDDKFLAGLSKNPELKNYLILIHGGFIRDTYYDKKVQDIDIRIVNQSKKKIIKISKFIKKPRVLVYKHKHSSIFKTYLYEVNEHTYDITTANKNELVKIIRYTDYKLNSLHFDLHKEKIIDFYNGIADLRFKKLNTIIDSKKLFSILPHYVFRGIRLCLKNNLTFDKKVAYSISNSNKSFYILLKNINKNLPKTHIQNSSSIIFDEIQKCIKHNPKKFINLLESLKINKNNIKLILGLVLNNKVRA